MEGNGAENAVAVMARAGLDWASAKSSGADETRGLVAKSLLCHYLILLI